ncbi:MAG: hypothetical protein LH473_12010, partial [Chitinophagales bacterium]|nr:hypothetical protein [Chitinophagales bacterium]
MKFLRSKVKFFSFLFVASGLLSTNIFAQTTGPLPDDREGFLKAITSLFNDTKRDDCKETAKQLEEAWPLINSSQQGDIIELAQAMRARKMLTLPYFLKYFNVVIAFQHNKISLDIWDDWKNVSSAVIANIRQGNNKKYEDYLDFSLALFTKHALSSTISKTWKFDSEIYDLEMVNDTAVLKFIDGTIIGITEGDSIRIDNTSGSYYPMDNIWKGTKGRANFTRVGYGEEDAYVTFSKYKIDMNQSTYSVDTAKLHYDIYKKSNVLGSFSDKLLSHVNTDFATYPRFTSFKKDLLFEGVAPYTKMYGGLELVGAKMNLFGTPDQPCVIKIYRFDNQLGLIAKSQHFDIRKNEAINAAKADIKLMLGKDSVLHGGLTMRYNIVKRELFLFRGKNGIEKSAFNDYYHGFEMSPELFYWDMNEPEVLLRNIATQGQSTMVLESFDYYRKGKIDKYTGLADYNFIDRLKQISDRTGEKEFYTEDLAKKIDPKYSAVTIQPMLYKLVEDGFIDYDDKRELVTLRYKLFKYELAKDKKVDYDNIRIESVVDSVNGIMDMRSYNLTLNGVRKIVLSDSNFVVVFPYQNNIVLKKDRSFDFNGAMFAGRLDMSGKGFSFNYNDFKIDLSTVDSVVINIPNGKRDANGQATVGPINSVISNVTGDLQIDTRDNRSGIKRHPQFPILTTTQPSFVYYDNRRTLGGAY